ncbi:nucleoid-associated protein [Ferruginibacter yonginensis]|uniref:Nucleoid-associated protein n=1 Tax=Ferruginibacter yonginensis TaxID=1310416 RepID=A0ABV8QTB4_9BACT
MSSNFETNIAQLSIHKVGNQALDEALILSQNPTPIIDDTLATLLRQYFLGPFEKSNEVYRLSHTTGNLQLNEVYHFAEQIFADATQFHTHSMQLAKLLYKVGSHPKIKSGEMYCCYFDALPIEGEMVAAIGIFKSESKEPYLTIHHNDTAYQMAYEEQAINIKKLDKGCIIFNTEAEEGYKVTVIDQTNQTEASYWIDAFLQLRIRNDAYNQTNTVLSIYKDFVKNEMDQLFDMSKTDKIDLLNRSIKYFKENDDFNIDTFSHEVINNEAGIASFKNYKSNYEQTMESPIPDSFAIHIAAVKKQARVYKSVLKLDKNFHIYIHGNNDLIEKGYDEALQMNYYKVYFREEV